MKRISDKGKIPDFFNNKRYDEHYKNCGVVTLAHEIQERQNISWKINSIFEDDIKNKKIITVKYLKNIDGKRVEYTPPPRTREQIIENDKKLYLRLIEGFAEQAHVEHPKLGKILNRKKPLEMFPRLLFDFRPYIQPLKEVTDDIEIRAKYALRENVDDYEEYPAISINLDFSDDAIIADVKKHLIQLRKQLKHKPKLLPPKEYLRKLKNFRALQVIDILLWQKLTDHHIEYETLAEFLFPQGQFTGKQLRETIIPSAKKLLDSKSNESAYMFYLADKK